MADLPSNPLVLIASEDTLLDQTGRENKVIPNNAILTKGWDDDQQVTAEHLNYSFNNLSQYISYNTQYAGEVNDKLDQTIDNSVFQAGDGLGIVNTGIGETVTYSLSTPDTVSTSTTNEVTVDGHTHSLDISGNSVQAGNGLTGGASLDQDPTLTLGTPSSVGGGSTNNVSATSHSHALSINSNIAIQTGTISHGGTIPLPAGYSQAQCRWFVVPSQIVDDTTSGDIGSFRCEALSNRVVVVQVEGRASSASYATYVIIGVK